MSKLLDWEAPADSRAAHANLTLAAMDVRAEAAMFKERYYEARDNHELDDVVHGLHLSMYCAIGRAAEMERALRGLL